ncbi:putative PEP-binding protein [Komagataeibacter intermedius]|nr:putative PEP-binding protein [Komagataeibacter intermedius]GAN88579.1 pyruvate phosphate dikinase [Komagataeibacter intermedius TF2]
MAGLPVTVRLLDPPLHEFLPHAEAEMAEVANALGKSVDDVRARCAALAETNPMLGHRGCRLGLTSPEIYAMQVRALIQAAVMVEKELGKPIRPEIMIPLVATQAELATTRRAAEDEIARVLKEEGTNLNYYIGTMIELPRAALQADKIAEYADFFSFGTNDLTQTAFGLSRDDAGSFLPYYVDHGLLPRDPFVSIDRDGVGALVRLGVERGRQTCPDLKLGICGEHGGDPDSIAFFDEVGLDYVSCSPFRVPVARLAAAQAALATRQKAGQTA